MDEYYQKSGVHDLQERELLGVGYGLLRARRVALVLREEARDVIHRELHKYDERDGAAINAVGLGLSRDPSPTIAFSVVELVVSRVF
jgi:hypothetical protein